MSYKGNSIYTCNARVPDKIADITNWHKDRNLIDGSTDNAQFTKLLEEVVELYATLNPDTSASDIVKVLQKQLRDMHTAGRVKMGDVDSSPADDIGDINVVLINIAERNKLTMQECLDKAWSDIRHRKGKMVNGVFVKEADLTGLPVK
tara:strand:- start:3294 stop:3737 length:444 start_codon:yes stop_codon:yes gene_type:complete